MTEVPQLGKELFEGQEGRQEGLLDPVAFILVFFLVLVCMWWVVDSRAFYTGFPRF